MTELLIHQAEGAVVAIHAVRKRELESVLARRGAAVRAQANAQDFKASAGQVCVTVKGERIGPVLLGLGDDERPDPMLYRALPARLPAGVGGGHRAADRGGLGPGGSGVRSLQVQARQAEAAPGAGPAHGPRRGAAHRPRLHAGPRHGQRPGQRHGAAADRDHRPRDRRGLWRHAQGGGRRGPATPTIRRSTRSGARPRPPASRG